MAITTILASGSTAASSSDVSLLADETVTLLVTGSGSVTVEMKNAAGTYRSIGTLSATSNDDSGGQLSGPITFRVSRSAGQSAGCDMDQ